jgi:hypothetical protein
MDAHAAATLRAAAEVFVPGPPHDDTPGAADVSAELFVEHYLEFLLPGLASAVPQLLDDRSGGRAFKDLPIDERGAVLAALAEDPIPQLRELSAVLGALSVAAVYGEWTGQDADGTVVRAPLGWEMTGFAGPSRGRAHLLR